MEVQVDVCLTSGKRAVLDDRIASLGARLHYLRYQGAHLPRFRKGFTRLLAAGHYDAIHDHGDFAGGVHLLCGLGELPPARVIHVHNPLATFSGSFKKRLARAVGRQEWSDSPLRLPEPRCAFFGSSTSRRTHRAVNGGSPCIAASISRRTHSNATEARARIRAEFGWSTNDRILLFVGRLESHFNQKNPRFALDIARECNARDPRVKALFAGAGDEARAADRDVSSAPKVAIAPFASPVSGSMYRSSCSRRICCSFRQSPKDWAWLPSKRRRRDFVRARVGRDAARVRGCAGNGHVRFAERVTCSDGPRLHSRLLAFPRPCSELSRTPPSQRSPFSIDSSASALLDAYGFVPAFSERESGQASPTAARHSHRRESRCRSRRELAASDAQSRTAAPAQMLDWTFYSVLSRPGQFDEAARAARRAGDQLTRRARRQGRDSSGSSGRALQSADRYDVLHCHHDVVSAVYLVAAARAQIRRRIVHVHNADLHVPTGSARKAALLREPMRRICLSTGGSDRRNIQLHPLRIFLRERAAESFPGRSSLLWYRYRPVPTRAPGREDSAAIARSSRGRPGPAFRREDGELQEPALRSRSSR